MDLEGLAQSFQCLQNLCCEGKSWSCLQGADRDGGRYTQKNKDGAEGEAPGSQRLILCRVLVQGPWNISSLHKFVLSDGSRGSGMAEEGRSECSVP